LEHLLEATGHIIEEDSQYAIRNYQQLEKTSLWVTSKGGEKHREIVDLQAVGAEVSDHYPDYSMPTRLSLDRVDEAVLNYDLIEDVLHLILINPEKNGTLLAPDGADISIGSGTYSSSPFSWTNDSDSW
jgi:ATP-dependent RNA helicase DHX29